MLCVCVFAILAVYQSANTRQKQNDDQPKMHVIKFKLYIRKFGTFVLGGYFRYSFLAYLFQYQLTDSMTPIYRTTPFNGTKNL